MNNISEERKRELEKDLISISERMKAISEELQISIHIDSFYSFSRNGNGCKFLDVSLFDHGDGEYKCLFSSYIKTPEDIIGMLSREFTVPEEE